MIALRCYKGGLLRGSNFFSIVACLDHVGCHISYYAYDKQVLLICVYQYPR